MEIIVAGLCGVLCLLAECLACNTACRTKKIETEYIELEHKPVARLIAWLFSRRTRKQWVIMSLLAMLVCAVTYVHLKDSGYIATRVVHIVILIIMTQAAIVDMKTRTIPNSYVLVLFLIAVTHMAIIWLFNRPSAKATMITCLLGAIIVLLFLLIMSRFTKGGIGMGDVKILSAIGLAVGIIGVIYVLVISLVVCMGVSVYYLVSNKKGWKDSLPFGPFLWIGYMCSVFLGLL